LNYGGYEDNTFRIMVAVMLTYLLGDVLRIFSGDFKAMGGMQDVTMGMFLGIAGQTLS
jgi:hypothetical protein